MDPWKRHKKPASVGITEKQCNIVPSEKDCAVADGADLLPRLAALLPAQVLRAHELLLLELEGLLLLAQALRGLAHLRAWPA